MAAYTNRETYGQGKLHLSVDGTLRSPAMNNTTIVPDVIVNNCFGDFNTVACIRTSILTFLGVLTTVLCVIKVIRLHQANHQNWHQYFIFYFATVECILGSVHWVLSTYIQIDFVLQWLKMIQFLVMCHFYWTLATRALRREGCTKRFLVPFLSLAGVYFTIVTVLGIVNIKDTFVECLEPYWLMMSSAEFIIVQLFCVAGFYITRRLNEISTLDSLRRSQKRDLWSIVIVFEFSALVGVLYDLSLKIIGNRTTGCSAIFNHAQDFFSAIFLAFMISKLLLPIWVMLFVFQPVPQAAVENDALIPALSDDGNSAFGPSIDEQYRQLFQPVEDYRTLNYDATPSINGSPGSQGPTPTTPIAPNGTTNVYNNKVNKNLGTIKEENSGNRQQQGPIAVGVTSGNRPRTAQKQSGSASKNRASKRSSNNQPSESRNVSAARDQTDGLGTRQVVEDRQSKAGRSDSNPRFYIQDNEEPQESTSPRRAKFQI